MHSDKNSPYKIQALLLGAGESKRFNGLKQLALIDEKPMLAHTLSMLIESSFPSICVVLGANATLIKETLAQSHIDSVARRTQDTHIDYLMAENYQKGMGASIAAGVKSVDNDITHVFIALGDQVEIRAEQCKLMVKESRKHWDKIVAAFYQGKPSAPAIFPRKYFSELALLNSDKGARDMLRRNMASIISFELPEGARDIDTRTDLQLYTSTTRAANNDTHH